MDVSEINRPVWQDLEKSLDSIMSGLTQGADVLSFVMLYTAVCNYCSSRQPENATNGLGSREASGETLYKHLVTYLQQYLIKLTQSLRSASSEQLLARYLEECAHYVNAAHIINDIFQYLNRHWIKRELDEGAKSIYDVYTLHLVLWHSGSFGSMREELIDAISEQVWTFHSNNNIELPESDCMQLLLESIIALQPDGANVSANPRDFYGSLLESPWRNAIEASVPNDKPDFLYPEPTTTIAHMEGDLLPRLEKLLISMKLEPKVPHTDDYSGLESVSIKFIAGDEIIETDRYTIDQSLVLKRLFAYFDPTSVAKEPIPILDVSAPVLHKVLAWCEHHKADTNAQGNRNTDFGSQTPLIGKESWEQEYFDIDTDMLFAIIKAANYLEIQPLLDRGCQQVANAIKGKNPAEIRRTFKIQKDAPLDQEA